MTEVLTARIAVLERNQKERQAEMREREDEIASLKARLARAEGDNAYHAWRAIYYRLKCAQLAELLRAYESPQKWFREFRRPQVLEGDE